MGVYLVTAPIWCLISGKGDVMPYGAGPAIRLAMAHAKLWQRYLICVAMIAGGAVLVDIGHIADVALAGVGCLVMYRMILYRSGRGRKQPLCEQQVKQVTSPLDERLSFSAVFTA